MGYETKDDNQKIKKPVTQRNIESEKVGSENESDKSEQDQNLNISNPRISSKSSLK